MKLAPRSCICCTLNIRSLWVLLCSVHNLLIKFHLVIFVIMENLASSSHHHVLLRGRHRSSLGWNRRHMSVSARQWRGFSMWPHRSTSGILLLSLTAWRLKNWHKRWKRGGTSGVGIISRSCQICAQQCKMLLLWLLFSTSSYKTHAEEKYTASQKEALDFSKPIYATAALYTACRYPCIVHQSLP